MPTPFNNSMSFQTIIGKLKPVMNNGQLIPPSLSLDQCQNIQKSLIKLQSSNIQYSEYRHLHQMKEPTQQNMNILKKYQKTILAYKQFYLYCQKMKVDPKNTLWDNIKLMVNRIQKMELLLEHLSNKEIHKYQQFKDQCQNIVAAYPILDEVYKIRQIQKKYVQQLYHPSTISQNIEEIIKTFKNQRSQIRGQFQHNTSELVSKVEKMERQVKKAKDQLEQLKRDQRSQQERFEKSITKKYKQIDNRIKSKKKGVPPQQESKEQAFIKKQISEKVLKIGKTEAPKQQRKMKKQLKSMKVLEPHYPKIEEPDWQAQISKLKQSLQSQYLDLKSQNEKMKKQLKSMKVSELKQSLQKKQLQIFHLKQSNERHKKILSQKKNKLSIMNQILTQFMKKITEFHNNPSNTNLSLMVSSVLEKLKSSQIIPQQYQMIQNRYAKETP